ncbi:MAG: G-D-S-L family lipolytic protein [Saprospiraceae bacterium]|nr:G-D-S-L family lipolytic protein [Saprospiraceae bacterium]HQV65611.1 GDSL-type esterase/lipase family protein [Saprospiraceae bacterium]
MIRIYLLLLVMMTMISADKKPIKIIFFGDSITEMGVHQNGYIDLMQKRLDTEKKADDYQIIGSGKGGNKVYDLFFRLEKDVLSQNPDVVVIWIGVNDVWHKSTFGTGTDFDKFVVFYSEIIKKCSDKGIKVVCCTPACIGEKIDNSNPQDGDLNEISKIIRKTAFDNNAKVIDFRKAFLEYNLNHNKTNSDKGTLTNDRVHLNDLGNTMVADMMWENLIAH